MQDVRVETFAERLEFGSGEQLLRWLVNSNPVAGEVLAELGLTDAQVTLVEDAIERMVRERAAGSETAVLTVGVNFGVGTR